MGQEETKLSSQDIWALFRETDRMFRETREQIAQMNKETDEKITRTNRETSEQITQMNRETDLKIKETSEQIARTEREVGALSGRWGEFVEGLIAPGAVAMFQERGIKIDYVFQRAKSHKNGDSMEIDVLGVNNEYAVLIEVKSTLDVRDVREHIERMKAFKRFFPAYSDKKIVGAVAGIKTEGEADKFAYRQGLFVIGQSGDTVEILNDKSFKPKTW